MKWIPSSLHLLMAAAVLTACGGGTSSASKPTQAAMVAVLGDSLTNSGFYVTPGVGWVEKLAAQVKADGMDAQAAITVVNQGISGETTTQALARLPSVLATYKPTHVFLGHGTNDIWWECAGCFDRTQANLLAMAKLSIANGAKVTMTDFTFKIRGDAQAQAYSAMHANVARATNSTYLQIIEGVPFDTTHYHPELVHLKDAAQEALKNNAVRALYPQLK